MNSLGCYGTSIPTYTGNIFDPFNPDSNNITIEDIAHHLSNLCRFNGSTFRFYSVAEHSLMVSYLVHPSNAKWALLHDASEAYVIDLPKPLKVKFPGYQALEKTVQKAVCYRFGLNYQMPNEVKKADLFALAQEGQFFQNKGIWKDFWKNEFSEFMTTVDKEWIHTWNDHFHWHNPLPNELIAHRFKERADELGIK